jgi:DNA-binding CsgD family transcriptional regulator/tetratricopeptide (TPR) repeat protein
MSAWFAGDFERCLELCSAVRARDTRTRTHVLLLTARALVRLYRFDEAHRALQALPPMADRSDEWITAQMVAGEMHVRKGNVSHGLAVLQTAQDCASEAHRTIRAEVSLNIALAYYCLHDFDAADEALSLVDDDADLIHARAVQYKAWITWARGDTGRASSLFLHALRAFDEGQYHDRYFEANCVRALAHLAVERIDRRIWDAVCARRSVIDWSAKGLAEPHFFVAYSAATYRLDIEGDPVEAAREARHAERIAPSDAFRVQARCKRAAIARQVGEHHAHRDHVDSAAELFGSLDMQALAGDEKLVAVILAEELARIRPAEAASLVDMYRSLLPPTPMRISAQSPLASAYRNLVDAMTRENSGDRTLAVRTYRAAFDAFREFGYTRRAATAALSLWRLTGERMYYSYLTAVVSELSPRSWLRREIESAKTLPVRMTPAQREVLCLICEGKSNPEIARMRKRSLHTIRNVVARLFQIFDVTSREQLAVECVRRGLYTPN